MTTSHTGTPRYFVHDSQTYRPAGDGLWQLIYLSQHSLSGNSKALMCVEPLALARSHEQVVSFTVHHLGTFLTVLSILLSLTCFLLGGQYEHRNCEGHQGFVVARRIPGFLPSRFRCSCLVLRRLFVSPQIRRYTFLSLPFQPMGLPGMSSGASYRCLMEIHHNFTRGFFFSLDVVAQRSGFRESHPAGRISPKVL